MGNNCSCIQNRYEDSRVIEKEANDNKDTEDLKMNGGMSLSEEDIITARLHNDIGINSQTHTYTNSNSNSNNNSGFTPANEMHTPYSPINLVKAGPVQRKISAKKNTNCDARQSPLEVINELNADFSKGSFDHKDSSIHHQKQMMIKDDAAIKVLDAKSTFFSNNHNHSHNHNQGFKLNEYYNENYNDNNNNSNINININNHINVSIEEKKVKRKSIHRSAQKKTMKEMQINTIIPISKLKYINENDLLIQGEFFKSTKDKDSKRFVLTSNFLYLTKAELRIYRSKEAMIYRQSPLQKVFLCNIVSCELIPLLLLHTTPTQSSNQNQRYTFLIEYLQNTNGMKPDLVERLQNSSQFDFSLSKIQFDSSMMKNKQIFKNSFKQHANTQGNSNNIIDTNARKKGKKMTLLGSEKEEELSVKKNDDLLFENNNASNKIYFSSENEENVMKWVCAINYLISR